MEYKNGEKDFIKREKDNLNMIEKHNGFEFTQLLNNFISILIVITATDIERINSKPIFQNGLSCTEIGKNTYKDNYVYNTSRFISHLRNACCHYGIRILSIDGEIDTVLFKDVKYKYKNNKRTNIIEKYCEIKMTKEEIEKTYIFLYDTLIKDDKEEICQKEL